MLKLAVFGHPVAHSLSPRIHAMFAEAAGIDVDYRAVECRAGGLAGALARFRAEGGHGCNLTVPLKAEGLALAAHATGAARDADAANTLVAGPDGWHADNTDGPGLVADLERLDIDLAGRRVLVLGAGGAVAGILGPLLAYRPAEVCLVNRDRSRAERLAARFADRGAVAGAGYDTGPPAGRYDRLIQGTSLGHQGAVPPVRTEWLATDAIGYDLNYGKAYEPFAAWCSARGIRPVPGLGMLVEQAALAFELFTGLRPDTRPAHAALAR